MRRLRVWRAALLRCPALVVALALPLAAAGAQQRAVEGRVLHPDRANGDSTGMAPASGVMVTLHRVGRDNAGPVDSMRTDARGGYRFRWTPAGMAEAVYFASVTWDGIAYFTAPLRDADTRGDKAEITVFDTTSRTFPLSVRGRHLIVGASDSSDSRTVIEVFELSNDSVRALVSVDGDAAAPTWSVVVPQAARDARATDGDVSPDAFAFSSGRVSVFAPIAPGLKQLSFSYRVPSSTFPVAFTAANGATVFEILLEEPQGTVSGGGFTAVDPVQLEGRSFRRFLAQDVKPGERVIVELPQSRAPGRNLYIAGLLVAIGFLMLLMLMRAMQKRSSRSVTATLDAHRGASGSRATAAPLHERLAAEIAALDAHYARQQSPSDAVRVAYEGRRAELVDALKDALAGMPAGR